MTYGGSILVKIKEYKVRDSGLRGCVVTLPQLWLKDLGLSGGDSIMIYRDEDDRLVLVAKKHENQEPSATA